MHRSNHFRRLAPLLAVVGAMLVVAAPASASSKPTTGTRIGLFAPPTTFPANTPFYVKHGFACDFSEADCPQAMAGGLFTLYVDGVPQPSTLEVDAGSGGVTKWWITNVTNGLPAGDHTLVGVWTVKGAVVLTVPVTIMFT
jgi:hypothetical protein